MNIDIKKALINEYNRQNNNIELIASENFVSNDILKLQGSILTNKYAEGYPSKRYYGGCQYIDDIENLAIEFACKLFNCKYANVQPHSGSSANMAVYRALLNPKDKIMGMNLSHGGHLTHGHSINFSGMDYEIIPYDVDKETETIDYDLLETIALNEKPKLIVAGASAYSRKIDFKRFKEISDKCGALLMVDMAHIAGLVATNLHENPLEYADIVTTTTHKTLRGPRGGLILTNSEEIIKKVNKTIFPGIQGGPLMHVIAAKAQCFYEAMQPEFVTYQKQVLKNINVLCDVLKQNGLRIVSGKTENHLILVDVTSIGITGLEAEKILDSINITVNKNTIPYDTNSPAVASGIRIGSPAMTSRGMKENEFIEIGEIIVKALKNYNDKEILENLKIQVKNLVDKFPLRIEGYNE
ncbi:MAG: serine hydroxymethyltransferase [Clostridium sp.]|nr:serine hydroxymethyltransferase [Clostridium sp.]MCM1444403.1 serine hydroxymethyltransferase [Candidatus Amulumruptor caecigallinarius]